MSSTRHEPISQYQIIVKHSELFTEVLYCDERDEAIALAAKTGGRAEAYVYGIGYQPIEKVLP